MKDIHTHILSGIDDGAHSFDESIRLCSVAADNRTSTIIATPHLFSYNKIAEISQKRDALITQLRAVLERGKIPLTVLGGFEVYCSESFRSVADLSRFTLNGSRYILLEFDFERTDIYEAVKNCDFVTSQGFVPVIAHPERYAFFIDDYDSFNCFASRNVLFQLNAGSFLGHYGHLERRLAYTLLSCGYCDFLATDAHSSVNRSANLLEMICGIGDAVDFDEIKRLTDINPSHVIENKPVAFSRGKVIDPFS